MLVMECSEIDLERYLVCKNRGNCFVKDKMKVN